MTLDLWTADAAPAIWAPPASFSFGFPTAGDVVTQTPPTHVGGHWVGGMVDEIRAVIEGAGLTFDPTDTGQFLAAIKILCQYAPSPPPPPPPPPPPAGDGALAALLLHFDDATVIDSSANNYPFALFSSEATQLSAVNPKFGARSLQMTGNGSNHGGVYTTAGPVIGDNDFTASCWVYLNSHNGQTFLMDSRTNDNNNTGFALYFDGAGRLAYYSGLGVSATSPDPVALSGWTHIECSRDSAKAIRMFINGSLVATGGDIGTKASGSWTIGAGQYFPLGISPLDGFIDDFRLVNGHCVHTEPFTPPTGPYVAG